MSFSFFTLIIWCLCIPRQEEQFPKEFRIGSYTYMMSLQKGYNHDDDVHATYFVVQKKGGKKHQISSCQTAEHDGNKTIQGGYRITKRFIEFKEIYSNNSIDSMLKRYYPNKSGNLILTEYTDFKDGKANRTHY